MFATIDCLFYYNLYRETSPLFRRNNKPGNAFIRNRNQNWQALPDHFQFVLLEEFIVMPNHTHGIIIIDKPDNDGEVVDTVETGHALSLRQFGHEL